MFCIGNEGPQVGERYLGKSLNGSHILRALQAPKFGPLFTCNMLRETRRHAIDGDPGAKSRRSKDENGAKHGRQGRNQKHAKPSSPRLHNIKFAHICVDMKKIGLLPLPEHDVKEGLKSLNFFVARPCKETLMCKKSSHPCSQCWWVQELGQICLLPASFQQT